MIIGQVREAFPRIQLELPGPAGLVSAEFIVDSGFEGDLSLPPGIMRRLDVRPLFKARRGLADGSRIDCRVYQLDLEWNEMARSVQVLELENDPLVGVALLEGCQVSMHLVEGGEVVIEFPD